MAIILQRKKWQNKYHYFSSYNIQELFVMQMGVQETGNLCFPFINFGIIQYNFKENDCVSHAILINYKYYINTICYGSILEQFIMSTIVTLGDVMFFVVILIVLSPRHQRSNVNL